MSASSVVDTLEILSRPDRPVDRAGGDSKLRLDVIEQIEGIPCIAVHLVDECKDGDVPHDADLEQLSCLGLDALGRIDDHDRRVCRHQCPVGILREVLMSRCIQNIDAESLVWKLKNRAGHGDSSLLLDVHPVGDCMACRRLPLHGAGKVDRPSVQQELLRQGCLSGIRMGDDCKGSSFLNFRSQVTHYKLPGHDLIISHALSRQSRT